MHFVAAIIVIALSIFLKVSHLESIILGVMILMVMGAEMVNTAIEEMVDLITTEHRQGAETAKDVAAGMVLLTVMGAVVIGIMIFAPYLSRFFK